MREIMKKLNIVIILLSISALMSAPVDSDSSLRVASEYIQTVQSIKKS